MQVKIQEMLSDDGTISISAIDSGDFSVHIRRPDLVRAKVLGTGDYHWLTVFVGDSMIHLDIETADKVVKALSDWRHDRTDVPC